MLLSHPEFWQILEESGSIDGSRGMRLHKLVAGDSNLRTFTKTHSYGEFIFDWAWAQAYERNGLPYYPKLTSMVPFTPATAPHFIGADRDWPELLRQHDELLRGHSSAHFLYTTPEENRFLEQSGYLIRHSYQFHFFNEGYGTFDEFLGKLKSKKAKQIRQERLFPGLTIERLTGADLKATHSEEMYGFYLRTLEEKGSIPYLTRSFFQLLFERLPGHVLYVRATRDEAPVAGALFLYDHERLLGRYWGSSEFVPNLHFELCYYQGIDFTLERGLPLFEAGVQGEHKVMRGFRPVLTTSAHRINHAGFSRAIADFIRDEKVMVTETMRELSGMLPFGKR